MHPLRTRRVQRSSVRLFALLGLVLTALLGFGTSSYFLNADEPTVQVTATAPAPSSADEAPTPAPPVAAAAAEPTVAEPASAPPTPPPPTSVPISTSILIKKSAFRLYLLESGNVVQSWPIALGKNEGQKRVSGDMKTPDGSFPIDEILDASYWTHDFGDGKGEIEGAYGPYFISLDTSNLSGGAWDGIGIHGTHDPASIGTRASEGCIRMHNNDLLTLKNQISVGTQVTIEE
jgi:erfK/ybiS/ycfS/ynhG family protein